MRISGEKSISDFHRELSFKFILVARGFPIFKMRRTSLGEADFFGLATKPVLLPFLFWFRYMIALGLKRISGSLFAK